MADIAAVVDKSDACNVSQLVYNKDAEVVPARDWATCFPTLEDRQQSTTTSSSPPHSQGKCLSDTMLTHQKHHCLFFEMTGTLLLTTFLLRLNQRSCQMKSSDTCLSISTLFSWRSIMTLSLLSPQYQTQRENA